MGARLLATSLLIMFDFYLHRTCAMFLKWQLRLRRLGDEARPAIVGLVGRSLGRAGGGNEDRSKLDCNKLP